MSSASAKTIDLTSASKSKVPSASVGSQKEKTDLDAEVRKFRKNQQELKNKSDIFSIIGSSLDGILTLYVKQRAIDTKISNNNNKMINGKLDIVKKVIMKNSKIRNTNFKKMADAINRLIPRIKKIEDTLQLQTEAAESLLRMQESKTKRKRTSGGRKKRKTKRIRKKHKTKKRRKRKINKRKTNKRKK